MISIFMSIEASRSIGGGGGGDRFEVSGDVKPLLSSCLALGSSLLETYLPDGNRRPSNNREQEFLLKTFSTSCLANDH